MIRTVMVSGFFFPFHDVHLDYIEQALAHGNHLIVLLASDKQMLMKKGKVYIPETARHRIVDLILTGMAVPHNVVINIWDEQTTLIAEALSVLRPAVLFRGGDKTLETMPDSERQVCEELGIIIKHAVLGKERHSSEMLIDYL